MSDLQQQAISLAKKGFRVLPLAPGSRIPKGLKQWQQKATNNTAEVQRIWKRLPNANVGILTGGDFLVLDVDVKKGKNGLQTLSALQKVYNLPKTYTVRTPTGGLHLYYKHPAPGRSVKNVVNWKIKGICEQDDTSGIDIRAEGGQVVAPGMFITDRPGQSYQIIFDIPMVEIPGSLAALLPYNATESDAYGELLNQSRGVSRETQQHSTPTPTPTPSAVSGSVQGSKIDVSNAGGVRQVHQGGVGARVRAGVEAPESSAPDISDSARGGSTIRPGDRSVYGLDGVDLPDHVRRDSGAVPGSARSHNAAAGLVTASGQSEYSEIPDRIAAGHRDDTLFRFMCSWRERNYPLAHAAVLAKELHLRMDQPAGDVISLADVLAKLKRVYDTYTPAAQEAVELQAIQPTISLEALAAQQDNPVVLEPQKAVESVLEALNRFVFCIEGNSIIDTTKHPAYSNIKMDAFKSGYGNIRLRTSNRVNAKLLPLPKLWIEHTNRQTVDDYGYRPRGPKVYDHLGTRFYNKWAPSELEEKLKENSITPDPVRMGPFFAHLDYLFDDDRREREAFLNWLAYSVRYPERRVAHGVLLVSDPGVGKSWFYKLLQRLLGPYEVNSVGNEDLDSQFNDWIYGCSMVVIHELMTGNKRHVMQQLLSKVTEERLMINAKHKQRRMRDIYANILAFSNHGANAAALMAKDRRFFVYQSAASKASPSYYRELFDWLDTDGPLHLLQHIHQLDLSKFNPGAAPMMTVAKARMEYSNMSLVEQAIADGIEDFIGPFVSDIVSTELVEKYLESIMDMTPKDRSHARIAISSYCPPLKQSRYRVGADKRQYRLRAIRNGKKWCKAEADDVVAEYLKALQQMHAPVHLEAVK